MEAEMYVQAAMMARKVVKVTGADKMIEDLVKTHLRNRAKGFFEKQKDKKELELIENKLSEYMIRSYRNHIYMNTIVFGNQQKTIDDLYMPLKVLKKDRILSKGENKCDILINSYNEEFLPKYQKIVLIDNAGMGKSTIAKYLYLSAITENKGIPIFIELRKLSYEEGIIDFIMNEINGISESFDKDKVLKLIEKGNFIFFFDGYDEINKANKMRITNSLQNFISKTGNNTFLITSRGENELASFGDFQSFYIKPLEKEEAYNLIKRYSDNNGKISSALIAKIEEDKNFEIIKEFLENPLMVSLLCESFKCKPSIPHKKHAFYRQVYDALFENHDYSKKPSYYREKKSGLNLEDFHKILRTIGFITLTKGISYSKENLIKIVSESKTKNTGIEFKEDDLVYDLIHNVPIFIKEGIEYRWSHKSFQEYFAACYISFDSDKKNSILEKISNGKNIEKYYNVLDFYYDIDYKNFERYIIYPKIKSFIEFYTSRYNDVLYRDYFQEDIKLRKEILFGIRDFYMYITSEMEEEEAYKVNCDPYEGHMYILNKAMPNIAFSYSYKQQNIHVKFQKELGIEDLIKLLGAKNFSGVKAVNIRFCKYEDIMDIFIPGLYKLDDDISNIFNKKEYFNCINDLLLRIIYNIEAFALVFDYDKCVEIIRQFDKNVEEEKSDIDFL